MSDQNSSPIGGPHARARRRRRQDPAYAAAAAQLAPYEALARLVIRYRMDHDLRQEDLAEMMGTSPTAISRLESGHHRPSVETLQKLARAFNRRLVIGFADFVAPEGDEPALGEPLHGTVDDRDADLVALA